MSELGQQLREARLQKGMSLDDVQEMTKIRKRYLEAHRGRGLQSTSRQFLRAGIHQNLCGSGGD